MMQHTCTYIAEVFPRANFRHPIHSSFYLPSVHICLFVCLYMYKFSVHIHRAKFTYIFLIYTFDSCWIHSLFVRVFLITCIYYMFV